MQAMYIRVKRNKTTYFIQCDPTETALNIKQKLHALVDQPPDNQRLTLVATNDVLDDSKTLADQKVENDAIVALSVRKGLALNLMFDFFFSLSGDEVDVELGLMWLEPTYAKYDHLAISWWQLCILNSEQVSKDRLVS
ncbi:hypothetical protein ACMD2_23490 [Ananas comosus]|uniref:Ubiquitin-like domain-containing protein n=1 Tax=Ananas comosus TaxID=4615 RepID=A0A199VU75_ANACO|nr:hypothetical protein ACMD2_23490 [Ananas comosus]